MLKFIPILLLCFIITILAQDVPNNAGTASGLLLRFDPSPRVSAMSGAFTALGDDENALLYNAGALTNFRQGIISLNHTEWFEDIRVDNISFGYYLSRKISLGAFITHMWLPAITSYDAGGVETGSINVSSSIAQLGMGYEFTTMFSAGVALKYLNDKLGEYSASAFAADIGLHFKLFKNHLLAGLAVQNIGTKLKFEVEEQEIPMVFRGGLAWRFIKPDISISTDVVKAKDTDAMVLFGAEYVFLKQFALRVGNKFTANELFTPSFGVGFGIRKQYHFNYTFSTFSDLGGTHRIGFTFKFDTPAAKRELKPVYPLSETVVLRPPANVEVEFDGNVLIIRWDRVPGMQYNIYARHSSQKDWIKINKSVLYNNMMQFKSPKIKGALYFRVSSVLNDKESKFSEEVHVSVE